MDVLKWLPNASRAAHESPPTLLPPSALARIAEIEARVKAMELGNAEREADQQAMLDRLARLYRRVSARMLRESEVESDRVSPLFAAKARR